MFAISEAAPIIFLGLYSMITVFVIPAISFKASFISKMPNYSPPRVYKMDKKYM